MKYLVILFSLSLLSFNRFEDHKRFNFILMIDDVLPASGSVSLKLKSSCSEMNIINLNYNIGEIMLSKEAVELFSSDNTECYYKLMVEYSYLCKGKVGYKTYEIDLENILWRQPYVVLRIYNTEIGKNRRSYFSLPGKTYTFEIDSPDLIIHRVKKRFAKSKCR